jgi:mono/diheme cytochrome c family protein
VIGLFREIRFAQTFCSMKNGWLTKTAICVAVGIVVAGCKREAALSPREAEGKHLYDVRCAHCHDGNDLGLKNVPPNIHRLFDHATLPGGAPAADVEVQKVVIGGKGMMPSFASRFTDQQMSDLLLYLHKGVR